MSKLYNFSALKEVPEKSSTLVQSWHVLVVDNDQIVPSVDQLMLNNYKFEQQAVTLHHANNAEQAKLLLKHNSAIAVMLLDVSVETETAALNLVSFVRKKLNNQFLRIVLRTKKLGQSPKISALSDHDISDYRTKSDMTADTLQSCLTAALRSFKDIQTIQDLAATRQQLNDQIDQRNRQLLDINNQLATEKDARETVEKELFMTNRKLESILNNSNAIISLKTINGVYDLVNQAFVEGLELKQQAIIGYKDEQLFEPEIWQTIKYTDKEVLKTQKAVQSEEILPTKDGDHYYLCIKFPVFNQNREVHRICSICTDITERLNVQNELLRLAQYDALTNLPNRALFVDRVSQVISRTQWHGKHAAVMYLDLDRFKQINDTLGHQTGDKLLIEVANRLQESIRDGDSVSRLGGDEFAVLLTDLANENDIVRVVNKITASLTAQYIINGRELMVTPSIGISRCPLDSTNVQSLLKKADVAMYKAKQCGRNTYCFYLKEDDAKASEQLTLELECRKMVNQMDQQLRLLYQPKVNLHDGEVESFEALLRWQHPQKGMISPAEFIPMLEETGMIVEVGNWVLYQACNFARQCSESGIETQVAVNLSPRQFKLEDLIKQIVQILEETRCDPRWLELELTEGALVEDIERTAEVLHELAAMGITLSIDDFGTGYSSLNYLKRFPFKTLKIDRSFISNAPQIKQEKAIVTTISQLAYNLEMSVVAEGVETLAQYHLLKELSHREHNLQIQGFLFSEPLEQERAISSIGSIKEKWQNFQSRVKL